jgi:hypothetical protein
MSLGRTLGPPAAREVVNRTADRKYARIEIDVRPPESAQLAPAGARSAARRISPAMIESRFSASVMIARTCSGVGGSTRIGRMGGGLAF